MIHGSGLAGVTEAVRCVGRGVANTQQDRFQRAEGSFHREMFPCRFSHRTARCRGNSFLGRKLRKTRWIGEAPSVAPGVPLLCSGPFLPLPQSTERADRGIRLPGAHLCRPSCASLVMLFDLCAHTALPAYHVGFS